MLLASFLASLLVGWARGGSLVHLSRLPLAQPELILGAFVVQAGLVPALASTIAGPWVFMLVVLSYLVILATLAMSRIDWAFALISVGVAANLLVILVNSGMPVDLEAAEAASGREVAFVQDGLHVELTDSTRLGWLADVIPVPLPTVFGGMFSAGDVLLAAGLFIVVQKGMRLKYGRRIAE